MRQSNIVLKKVLKEYVDMLLTQGKIIYFQIFKWHHHLGIGVYGYTPYWYTGGIDRRSNPPPKKCKCAKKCINLVKTQHKPNKNSVKIQFYEDKIQKVSVGEPPDPLPTGGGGVAYPQSPPCIIPPGSNSINATASR